MFGMPGLLPAVFRRPPPRDAAGGRVSKLSGHMSELVLSDKLLPVTRMSSCWWSPARARRGRRTEPQLAICMGISIWGFGADTDGTGVAGLLHCNLPKRYSVADSVRSSDLLQPWQRWPPLPQLDTWCMAFENSVATYTASCLILVSKGGASCSGRRS